MNEIIKTLFAARDAAHTLHLRTRSFAKHLALNDLYDGLLEKADELAEVWQGKHGIMDIGVIDDSAFMQLAGGVQVDEVSYIRQLASWVDGVRQLLDSEDSYIHNIWDEITAIVYRAKYKIENLQ